MKLILNILKWFVALTGVIVIVLFSLSFLLSDKVAEIILRSLNDEISTKIEVQEYSLSFLKRFPKAAVQLKDVIIWSSPTFDKGQFKKINTDTLLTAASAFLEFSMADIINEKYDIDKIDVEKGRLNIFTDSSGNVNYEVYSGTNSESDDNFVINLEKINASSVTVRYVNTATTLDLSGIITSGSFKSRIAGDIIDFTCNADLVLRDIDILSTPFRTNASVSIDLNLHQSDSGIFFRKGNMRLENFKFGLSGSITSDDIMDLRITGQDIDLARIKKYLPEEFLEKYNEYSPSGILKSECRIYGLMSWKQNPGVELMFSVGNGKVRYGRSDVGISGLNLNGRFTNGLKRGPETWLLDLENIRFTIGSEEWSGAFRVSNITDPYVDVTFSGEIKPGEILSFVPMPEITSAGGSFRLNMILSGKPGRKKSYDISDLFSLRPDADIAFNSFYLTHKDERWSVGDVDGNVMIARNLWAEDLVFSYKGHRFRVNGEFDNLPAWLDGRNVKLKVNADISTDNLDPGMFLGDTSGITKKEKRAFAFPSDIEARIRFRTDNLVYGSFSAEKVSGVLYFHRNILDISDLAICTLGGTAGGEFYLAQQGRSNTYISHGSFTFKDIDITKTFTAFRNFGQDFLRAENIAGTLSGNLTLLMPLDSMLKPDTRSITAEGKYIIENGSLRNFEPVKALSGFIELSELENITFSKLENDLFIKNNYLAVPQMDIKSSAADFSVNGKHSFSNDYEYHVKVYLSEILSKKAKNNVRYSTEFGPVEEDGLGRTSVFLKLTGKGDDIKVTPDMAATRNNIKQNLKKEKGTLKTILNEEYGWFKSDSAIKTGTTSKPKFRVQFEETDTTTTREDTLATDENRGLNRIFRKKKGSDLEF
jgi:hypothetical protein